MEPDRDRPDKSQFLLNDGSGRYDNLPTVVIQIDDASVQLVPAPMPYATIVGLNVLFVAFFSAVFYFLSGKPNPTSIYVMIALVGIGTCALVSGIIYFRFKSTLLKGPVFVFDRKLNEISLPQHQVKFKSDQDVYIECITANREHEQHDAESMGSELNLVAVENGKAQRWSILTTSGGGKPFGQLPYRLAREISIPVRRVYVR